MATNRRNAAERMSGSAPQDGAMHTHGSLATVPIDECRCGGMMLFDTNEFGGSRLRCNRCRTIAPLLPAKKIGG